MGFEPQKSLNMGPQNITVPLAMGSFLDCSKNFSRHLFLSLDFLDLSCENWFVVTLSSINALLSETKLDFWEVQQAFAPKSLKMGMTIDQEPLNIGLSLISV